MEGRSSTRKQNPVFMIAATSHNVEPPRTGVSWKLTPFDFVRIFLVDLAHPAFVDGGILSRRGIFLRSIDIHNHVVGQPSGMSKHRGARKRGRLAPCIFLRVVELHVVHWTGLPSSPDHIDI